MIFYVKCIKDPSEKLGYTGFEVGKKYKASVDGLDELHLWLDSQKRRTWPEKDLKEYFEVCDEV